MSEEQLECYYRIPPRECGNTERIEVMDMKIIGQLQEIFRSAIDRSLKVMRIKLRKGKNTF